MILINGIGDAADGIRMKVGITITVTEAATKHMMTTIGVVTEVVGDDNI